MKYKQILISSDDNVIGILLKRLEAEKLLQFLMGLESNFGTIKSSSMRENPWPIVNQAYSKIIHEEQVLNTTREKKVQKLWPSR